MYEIVVFFFNDTATTEIYTLSLHDALPICSDRRFLAVTLGILTQQVLEHLSFRHLGKANSTTQITHGPFSRDQSLEPSLVRMA